MRAEKLTSHNFSRLMSPGWCHEITAESRETFVQKRLGEKRYGSQETLSAESVEADLRVLRPKVAGERVMASLTWFLEECREIAC